MQRERGGVREEGRMGRRKGKGGGREGESQPDRRHLLVVLSVTGGFTVDGGGPGKKG